MSKLQKKFKPYFPYVLPSFLLFYIFYVAKYYFILFQTIKQPLVLVLIPTWLFSILLLSKNKIMGYSISKKIKEKIVLYSLFITFLISYNLIFSSNLPLILAQTPSGVTCDNNPSGCDTELDCADGTKCDCADECSGGYCWGSSEGSYTCHSECAPCGNYAPSSSDCCSDCSYNSDTHKCVALPKCYSENDCAQYVGVKKNPDCSGSAYVPSSLTAITISPCALTWRACFMNRLGYTYYTPLGGGCNKCSHPWGVFEKVSCDSWPSGSEGDVCWASWRDLFGCYHHEGVWDPDDNACILKCDGKRESTDSDARDYCPGGGRGDGNCEQACGADPHCDEIDPRAWGACGNNNYWCDSNCNGYPPGSYDADSGSFEERYDKCKCVGGHLTRVMEGSAFIEYGKCCGDDTSETWTSVWCCDPTLFCYEASNCDECTGSYTCRSGSGERGACCNGVWYSVSGDKPCCSDDDCTGYESNIEYYCNLDTHTCEPKRACKSNDECAPGYCCTADPNLPEECKEKEGRCVPPGDIRCDREYICGQK